MILLTNQIRPINSRTFWTDNDSTSKFTYTHTCNLKNQIYIYNIRLTSTAPQPRIGETQPSQQNTTPTHRRPDPIYSDSQTLQSALLHPTTTPKSNSSTDAISITHPTPRSTTQAPRRTASKHNYEIASLAYHPHYTRDHPDIPTANQTPPTDAILNNAHLPINPSTAHLRDVANSSPH